MENKTFPALGRFALISIAFSFPFGGSEAGHAPWIPTR